MAKDYESFKEELEQYAQFYESIEIKTVAVKRNSEWCNLHTDIHFSSENRGNLPTPSKDLAEVIGYFHTTKLIEASPEIFESLFEDTFDGHEEPVVFLGNSNEENTSEFWKNNTYQPAIIPQYSNWERMSGLMIQSHEDDSLEVDQNGLEEQLRAADPPYYNVDDYIREKLGHTSYRFTKPQVQCYVPLYVRIINSSVTDNGEFDLTIEAHDSIKNITVSTWADKGGKVIDRKHHTSLDTQSKDGPFKEHTLTWQTKSNSSDISYSIFSNYFSEIRKHSTIATSIPYIVLGIILNKEPSELGSLLDGCLSDDTMAQKNSAEFADDFEAAVTTLFHLLGFTAYSPEWFDSETDRGSLPDVIAYAEEQSTIVVCECSLHEREAKMNGKASDALSSAKIIQEGLEKRGRDHINIISVYATPTRSVDTDQLPNSVEILSGERLVHLREKSERSSDPEGVLKEWDTYSQSISSI